MNRRSRSVSSIAAPSSYSAHPLLAVIEAVLPTRILDPLPPFRSHATWNHDSLMLVALFMAWSNASTLRDRFALARDALMGLGRSSFGDVGATYRGFSKSLAGVSACLIARLTSHLRHHIQHQSDWQLGRWVPLAVDGSKFDLPRTTDNLAGFGIGAHKQASPQTLVTMLWHLGVGLPWDWRVGPATASERHQLRAMIHDTPPETLFVGDAGFTGFDLLQAIRQSGRHFLIRAAGNLRLLTRLGYVEREGRHIVYLWPDSRKTQPPIVLRLLRRTVKKRPVTLVTSVLDQADLSASQAWELYRRRWGVEVQYRSIKQTMERRKMLSRSARYARAELHWTILSSVVLGVIQRLALASASAPTSRASCAEALRLIRRALRVAWNRARCRQTLAGLTTAVIDTYQRRRPKSRTHWPHKKNDPPPRPPIIVTATPTQVRQAKQLLQRTQE